MKVFYTLILLINIFALTSAQTVDTTTQWFQPNKLEFNASYYGETVWYPGFKVGAEYVIHETKKEKLKNSKKKGKFTKIKTNQFIITGNLGYYWQPHNYGSLFINSAVLYRRTAHKGFQYHLGLSPVGMNTFFFNETYDVSDDGTVEKAFLPARLFYSPSLIMGIGHSMDKKLTAWYLNLHVTSLIPYNSAVNFLIAVEFGFRFKIDKF